jgi:hypothetical protein
MMSRLTDLLAEHRKPLTLGAHQGTTFLEAETALARALMCNATAIQALYDAARKHDVGDFAGSHALLRSALDALKTLCGED